jgi:sec-independent protein translocase protein TatB
MFNIGFTEFLVIGVVALLVIGPKQLPEVARIVGRLLTELKRATQDLSGGLLEVTNEVKSSIEDTKQGIMNEGQKIVDSVTKTEEPQDSNEVDSLEPQKDQNEQS